MILTSSIRTCLFNESDENIILYRWEIFLFIPSIIVIKQLLILL